MEKRGVFFSTDALIALIIIFLTIAIAYPIIRYSIHESYIESDMIAVLSNLKIGEINNSYVKTLISQGKIKDLNKSILEQIGEFYVEDENLAKELANAVLSDIDTRENVGVLYNQKFLFLRNSSSYENAKNIRVAKQIISGIQEGESITGYSARAYLFTDTRTDYFYFGGYMGDGNISVNISYNGNLTKVEMEIAINTDFDVYINGNYSGRWTNSSDELTPKYYDLSAYITNFHDGYNLVKITGNKTYIAGGFFKISYMNATIYEEPERYYFPGIEGIINLYDGFYSPGQINSMNIFLHYKSNLTIFMNIGNTTVFRGNSTNDTIKIINNSELSSLLNYNQISEETIPLRLGTENISYLLNQSAYMDVFSVSTLPSSFNSVEDKYGNKGVDVITYANRIFIQELLPFENVRVGIVGTGKNGVDMGDYHNLSRNFESLNNTLKNWTLKGGVCLCCGIQLAVDSLINQSGNNTLRSVVLMADNPPTGGCGGDATEDAVNFACDAYANHSIRFDTITVGNSFTGFDMMSRIANCSNGTHVSGNYSDLADLYKEIVSRLIKLFYYKQRIETIGRSFREILYPDSYIEFNFTKRSYPYGMIIPIEKKFSNNYGGSFNMPLNSTILETRVISYSGASWTQDVRINENKVYNLTEYGYDYRELGDPYSIYIPNNLVQNTNVINVTTGLSPYDLFEGSENNKIIYKVVKNMTSFTDDLYANADGCLWNITFQDGSSSLLKVPGNYSGSNICYYPSSRQTIESMNDAIIVAVFNLLESLDLDSDGKIDISFSENNLGISSSEITGIPYSWYTNVEVRTWD